MVKMMMSQKVSLDVGSLQNNNIFINLTTPKRRRIMKNLKLTERFLNKLKTKTYNVSFTLTCTYVLVKLMFFFFLAPICRKMRLNFYYVGGEKKTQTYISPFLAYTYVPKLTCVSIFYVHFSEAMPPSSHPTQKNLVFFLQSLPSQPCCKQFLLQEVCLITVFSSAKCPLINAQSCNNKYPPAAPAVKLQLKLLDIREVPLINAQSCLHTVITNTFLLLTKTSYMINDQLQILNDK